MTKVPGAKFSNQRAAEQSRRAELYTECSIWWKRLDSDRPLSGKDRVRLQNFLTAVKSALSD